MSNTLKDYYKRIRSNGATAITAYELAKKNFDKQRKLYELPTKKAIYDNYSSAWRKNLWEAFKEGSNLC